MHLEIAAITDESYDLWDAFVASSCNGTIFHKSFWLNALGNDFDLWGIYNGGALEGGFVAPYRKFVGQKVISPPFLTPYSGLVLKKYEGKYANKLSFEKNLATELVKFLKNSYKWGVLNFAPYIEYMLPFIWEGFKVAPRYTYILEISDIERVWREMDTKERSNTRKAQADGLSVVTNDSFAGLMKVVEKTYQRQGIDLQKTLISKYFHELLRRNLCKTFICVDGGGNELAGSFIVWDERKAYELLSGYNTDKRGAVSLCKWHAIKFASEELGRKEYDFEGGMIPMIEKFFRKYGGRLTTYYEIRWGSGIDSIVEFKRLLRKRFNI